MGQFLLFWSRLMFNRALLDSFSLYLNVSLVKYWIEPFFFNAVDLFCYQ